MSFKQRILFGVILFAFLVVCYTTIASNYQAPKHTSNNFPRWITEEKIRAGYLYAKDDTKYAALMRSHGLNTVIVKGEFQFKERFAGTLEDCRQWAQASKKEKLHVFIAYNWQPAPKSWSRKGYPYRPLVYSDGSTGVAPCPRDDKFWQSYLMCFGKAIAKLSLVPDLQIDGIFVDSELYGSRERGHKGYGPETCFCDNCFSSFLLANSYKGPELPPVAKQYRSDWLKENKLLDSYFAFLKKDVESLAKEYEQNLHQINPSLMLGMYPTPKDWVRKAICRGFGTAELPMIIFATDSYSSGGASRIPRQPQKFYLEQGINAAYAAGLLFRCYGAFQLEQELPVTSRKCSGYWLFRMPMLWDVSDSKELKQGSIQQYKNSIFKANLQITTESDGSIN